MYEQAIRNFATLAERTGEVRLSSGYKSELVSYELQQRGHTPRTSIDKNGVWVVTVPSND